MSRNSILRACLLASFLMGCSRSETSAQSTSSLLIFRGISEQDQSRWVDSVYQSLDQRGRVSQLIMPIIYPRLEDQSALLKRLNVERWGGILFQKGYIADQRALTIALQEASSVPLLIALD